MRAQRLSLALVALLLMRGELHAQLVQPSSIVRDAGGTMDAVDEVVQLDMAGVGIPILTLTGTFANVGTTLVFEYDDGTGTFRQAQAAQVANETAAPVLRFVNGLTGGDALFDNGMFKFLGLSGAKSLRVRMATRVGGVDSVTATWSGGFAQPDVLWANVGGDVNHGTPENDQAGGIRVPPVKIGYRSHFTGTPESFTSLATALSASSTRSDVTGSAYGHLNTQIPNRTISKTITANGVSRDFPLEGVNSWGLAYTGTWTGTVAIEVSADNGSTFVAWILWSGNTTQNTASSITCAGTCTDNLRPVYASGFTHVRIRSTAWTSGTLTLVWAGTQQAPDFMVADVTGNIAHGAADSGNPVNVGGQAVAFNATPTAVDAADRTRYYGTRAGIPFTQPGHPNAFARTCTVTDVNGAQTGTACVTVTAGTLVVVTGISARCSAANTVNVSVRVMFDTDTTFPAASTTGVDGELLSHVIPPGGGEVAGFAGAVIDAGASDEDVRFSMDDPVGGSCTITVNGYTIAS